MPLGIPTTLGQASCPHVVCQHRIDSHVDIFCLIFFIIFLFSPFLLYLFLFSLLVVFFRERTHEAKLEGGGEDLGGARGGERI